MQYDPARTPQTRVDLFPLILVVFVGLLLLSWPILFAFDLWVLFDRGSLLNLDYLWSAGMQPAIDTYYQYGLLPVALQHVAFTLFGRGYWPMVGFTVAALLPMAYIWSLLLRRLPRDAAWIAALLCVAPMLLWINPNFPYSLVLLSMLGAIALFAEGRLRLALVVCAFGCWSVPSLPIGLAGMLVAMTIILWWQGGQTSLSALVRLLAPGAVCYLAIGAVLAAIFGWRSVFATALPIQGAAFYATRGWGFASIVEFVSPEGAGLRWYLFTRSGWWVLGTAMLFGLAIESGLRMMRARWFNRRGGVVIIFAVLQALFIFVAPGPPQQHLVYDPLIAGGVLIGLANLPSSRTRGGLLAIFSILAFLGNGFQVRETFRSWRDQSPSAATAGLYATPTFTLEWTKLVHESSTHPLLMLTYGTGVHHYFPSIQSPMIWFLEVGQLLPSDEERVFAQVKAAEIIVTMPANSYISRNWPIREQLGTMCLTDSSSFFEIRQRRDTMPVGASCDLRPVPAVSP